ncbi:Fic family protein [Janibacter sp. Y6]
MAPVWQVSPHEEATGREGPGMFREHDIHPFDGGMTPPAWPLVPAKVQDWIDLVSARSGGLIGPSHDGAPLPETIAEIHSAFEGVHPFIDGNGRTGRLVLNLLLVRIGLPPVVILKQQRPAYLTALQKSDDGDHGPLGEILARGMYDNLNRFILPNIAGPARMVPLPALVDEQFTLPALRQAARRGRLDAIQASDGTWRTSRKAVEEYARSRGRRGQGDR